MKNLVKILVVLVLVVLVSNISLAKENKQVSLVEKIEASNTIFKVQLILTPALRESKKLSFTKSEIISILGSERYDKFINALKKCYSKITLKKIIGNNESGNLDFENIKYGRRFSELKTLIQIQDRKTNKGTHKVYKYFTYSERVALDR